MMNNLVELDRQYSNGNSSVLLNVFKFQMKPTPEKVRIDKWLWAMRFFKSRALASEACEKGKISIGDQQVKPSRHIRLGDIISIRKGPFSLQAEVIQLTEQRQAAKAVAEYYKDVTSTEEKEKMVQRALNAAHNYREGRPSKKDRRDLDEFMEW
jgi:ribosome-associated heat shock protein Hsp15